MPASTSFTGSFTVSFLNSISYLKKKSAFLVSIVCIFLLLTANTSQAQIISTIFGTGTAGYNGDGIAATAAQSYAGHGVVVDTAGNIYVSEEGNHRIRKISVNTGLVSTIAGTGTTGFNGDNIAATTAKIYAPFGMAFDAAGNLYFADRDDYRVRKITMSTGIITTVAGTGVSGYNGDGIAATTAKINSPVGIEFDAAGNLYIADWSITANGSRIRKVDAATGLISTIAGTGTSGYNGDNIAATTAQLNYPFGVTFDAAGNLYISEWNGYRIRKITMSTGIINTFAGTGSPSYNGDGIAANTANINSPGFMKFDNAGNLYLGDAGNNRVRKIAAGTNIITTIAGTGIASFGGDGAAATAAQLNLPYGVYFDKHCNLLIADRNNNRIRKITGGFTGCSISVAPGNLASCQALPAVTINATNYNSWVPIYDTAGRIAAEINANGNVLGAVNVSLYTKNGACREDPSHRLFLNRNITITPQTQPTTAVDIRLYIRKAELDTLRTAMNSLSQPSGVATINEVEVFKNSGACYPTGGYLANRQTSTNTAYRSDYYFQLSVNSFSSFYFANKLLAQILPVQLFSFSGVHQPVSNLLQWKATSYANSLFILQRSSNSIDFTDVDTIQASNADVNKYFSYTDNTAGDGKWYYRLKTEETGVADKFSQIVSLGGKTLGNMDIAVLPNLVSNGTAYVQVSNGEAGNCHLLLMDMQEKLIGRKNMMLQNGVTATTFDMSTYGNGMYLIMAETDNGHKAICRFMLSR